VGVPRQALTLDCGKVVLPTSSNESDYEEREPVDAKYSIGRWCVGCEFHLFEDAAEDYDVISRAFATFTDKRGDSFFLQRTTLRRVGMKNYDHDMNI
jgi:hypothetical protein